MSETCETCRFWGMHGEPASGPFAEKPAKSCRRFPPRSPWGIIEEQARTFKIVVHGRTFHDDWCGEHAPAKRGEGE